MKAVLAGCAVSLLLVDCDRMRSVTDSTPPQTTAPTPAPAPKIEFDNPIHDFGTVDEGSTPKHTYVVRNTGTAPLLLREVYPSCGCTIVTTSADEIPAGGSGTIQIAYSTRGYPGDSNMTVTVGSNDPNQPTSILRFHANVK